MTYQVRAQARQQHAIGVFWLNDFTVTAPENASREQILDAWLAQYGNAWQLGQIVSFTPKENGGSPNLS